MRTGLILTNVVLFATVAFAQGPGGAKAPGAGQDMLITAQQMQDIMQKMPMKDGKPGAFSTRLFNANTFSCAFIRVTDPDRPHTHGDWSEAYLIQSGTGTIETGGTMKGPYTTNSAVHQGMFTNQDGKPAANAGAQGEGRQGRNSANNEISGDPPPGTDAAGTSIEGGRDQEVGPGDLILIPAGTPHVWKKINGNVVYLDIKFPKATD